MRRQPVVPGRQAARGVRALLPVVVRQLELLRRGVVQGEWQAAARLRRLLPKVATLSMPCFTDSPSCQLLLVVKQQCEVGKLVGVDVHMIAHDRI